jgi:hypothetical protein
MIDDQAPLGHELFQVAKAQAESQVPADAGHDHLRLEFPFPEQWRPSRFHGATLPDPQTQHFPFESWPIRGTEPGIIYRLLKSAKISSRTSGWLKMKTISNNARAQITNFIFGCSRPDSNSDRHNVPRNVDVPDPATFASSPGIVPGTARVFQRFVFLGDIVRVNGEQVKGIWTATATNILASPTPQPKQAIADAVRQNIIEMYFDLMQPDGTAIGNIMATGLTRGSPPPGAPLLQTGDTITIVGGTGAFLGVRGQAGMVDAGSPLQASAVEDPANRRTNGGATRSYVLHLIPMSKPEIANTASGPAVFHANFSPVNATQPARSGEILILRATGLGPTLPALTRDNPSP